MLARLDKTFRPLRHSFSGSKQVRRPAFRAFNHVHATTVSPLSSTAKQYGNGATFDKGFLVLSKIGRIGVRWSRPIEGAPKTVTISYEADGWYVIVSWAEVAIQPLPPTERETGIDVGLKVFLATADGEMIEPPRLHRRGEKQARNS